MADYLYDHFLARYELDLTAAERHLVQFLGSIDHALNEDSDPIHQPLVRHHAHTCSNDHLSARHLNSVALRDGGVGRRFRCSLV
jgi:hypothetical protein